jgi:hypothetical protein
MNDRRYATWRTVSMLHERQSVCYVKDRRYATWKTRYATWTTVGMLRERQSVCYMNDRRYATWKTDGMLREQQTICYVNDRQYGTWTTDSMPREWQTVCYMNDRRYATWATDSMLHERQTVCYMNDRRYATWTTESVLLMMVSEPTYVKDLTSCRMPHVVGWVIPDVSCIHGALVLWANQLLDCLNLNRKALCFFGPSGTTHLATQYNIQEDLNHQHHCYENPKSRYQNLSKEAVNIVQISYMYSQEC